MKKSNKILIFVLVVTVIMGIVTLLFLNKKNSSQNVSMSAQTVEYDDNNIIKNSNIEQEVVKLDGDIANNVIENSETIRSEELKKINLTDEEIVNILIETPKFESVSDLSSEEIGKMVYSSLNQKKIEAYKDRISNNGVIEFSKGEIEGIIYSLFGVQLNETIGYKELLKFDGNKYVLMKTNQENSLTIKYSESDVAAGTRYICFDVYSGQTQKASYAIGVSNVTGVVRCKMEL